MKCTNCWKEVGTILTDVVYNEWLKLMHYFEHERNEGEITDATYEFMVDALMSLKPYPVQGEENV